MGMNTLIYSSRVVCKQKKAELEEYESKANKELDPHVFPLSRRHFRNFKPQEISKLDLVQECRATDIDAPKL